MVINVYNKKKKNRARKKTISHLFDVKTKQVIVKDMPESTKWKGTQSWIDICRSHSNSCISCDPRDKGEFGELNNN